MINKLSLLVIVIFSLVTLAACGDGGGVGEPLGPDDAIHQTPAVSVDTTPGNNGQTSSDTTPGDTDMSSTNHDDNGTSASTGFALLVDDFLIEMDMNIEPVLAALGEPRGVFIAPSCAFDGEDRIFQYSSIQLFTYPRGDDDYIHTISFRDDSIRTTEGIRLGASLEDVIAAYGDDYEHESGMYIYKNGLTSLEFYIEDDMVIGITYGFTVNIT